MGRNMKEEGREEIGLSEGILAFFSKKSGSAKRREKEDRGERRERIILL